MKTICAVFALCAPVLLIVSCASVSPDLVMSQVQMMETREGRFVELPEGLKIRSTLETALSSARSRAGDRFLVRTAEPVTLDGKPLIPEGTMVSGSVTAVTAPRANLVKAKIGLSFESIALGGREYPFHTRASLDKSALIGEGAEFGGKEAAKAALGAAIPPLEVVFLAGDVIKGVEYYESSKEISLDKGTRVVIKINSPVCIPLK